jgi:hypothetical protein
MAQKVVYHDQAPRGQVGGKTILEGRNRTEGLRIYGLSDWSSKASQPYETGPKLEQGVPFARPLKLAASQLVGSHRTTWAPR